VDYKLQYIKIKDAIVEQIESGLLASRQKLPSERKLAESFDTTRVTLREALSLLESEGKIYREDRRGWFISSAPLKLNPAKLLSFRARATEQNRQPNTVVVLAKSVLANKQAASMLSLPPFSDVYQVERIRLLENRPIGYVTHYVRPDLMPNLLDLDISASLTETYREHFAISYAKTRQRIVTTSLQGDIAQALHCAVGTPALMIESINYGENGELIDCSIEYWRHDAICIETEITLL
tara:strand:+ start:1788 stop:2501 length:714 start_codon:yes stop_codon:yes gene_type:complete